MAYISWNRWYSFKSYVSSALWVVPLIAVFVYMAIKRVLEWFERWMLALGYFDAQTDFFALSVSGARSMLEFMITANLSFLVFTFSSLLVAIQVAGGQYTPRIIATTLLRDNAIRYIVGLFLVTTLFALRTLQEMGGTQVQQFQIFCAGLLGLASIAAFLFLIDYAARLLRPVSLVTRVGAQGIEVIQSIYPEPTTGADRPEQPRKKRKSWSLMSWARDEEQVTAVPGTKRGPPDRTVVHQGVPGVILAVNLQMLIDEAQRADSMIELAPQVGDFLSVDEPLFYLYGNADAVDEHTLRVAVACGSERTLEQDPMFAFRILADIALKALSPAINDPTTAVLAIDQLHRLLRLVGLRSLRSDEYRDGNGRVRVIFHTPNWENFVHITFREIRQCGASSLQVVRRLRAMIENLTHILPEHRRPALREELALLDRAIAREHLFAEDLALARVPDPQGLGSGSDGNSRD